MARARRLTERLYLYALTTRNGTWTYIGATVNPKLRARKWAWHYPRERFKVLMIGHENYVLEMERNLIRHCKAKGIPIRNGKAFNVPLATLRERGRKVGRWNTGRPKPWLKGRPLTEAQKRALELGRQPESFTPERREKMSAAQRGKPHPWQIGRKVSAATREKISTAQRGKPKRSNHTRWHVNRNVINPRCPFCKTK